MAVKKDTKPGFKTSEFWLSLVATLLGALMASGVFASDGQDSWIVRVVGGAGVVLAQLGYTAERGKVKEADAAKKD